MQASQLVESYKFWDVVTQWARESLQSEEIIARALARGVIMDGLRVNSTDPRWMKTDRSLTGSPYVGYTAVPGATPLVLRIEALEHLIAIVRRGEAPSRELLNIEFLQREDFGQWLDATGQARPAFWFGAAKAPLAA